MADRYCPLGVQKLFQNHDKALKIEWAVDRWVCKRKGRDGRYVAIGYCAPEILGDGRMWLDKLRRNDLQRLGGAHRVADEMERDEREAEIKRKLARRDKFDHMAREEFAVIQRKCGERISNAGMPAGGTT